MSSIIFNKIICCSIHFQGILYLHFCRAVEYDLLSALGKTMQIFLANLNLVQYYGTAPTEHVN